MKRLVVLGHGGYAEGVRRNLEMIVGLPERIYFMDLTKEDDLSDFEARVNGLLEGFGEDEVLFACDLPGASPFRVAALISSSHPGKYYTVAGLNAMAFMELSLNMESDMSIDEFAALAIDTTKSTVMKFPE